MSVPRRSAGQAPVVGFGSETRFSGNWSQTKPDDRCFFGYVVTAGTRYTRLIAIHNVLSGETKMLERLQFYIDGKWVDPVDAEDRGRDQSRDRGSVRARSRWAPRPMSTRRSPPPGKAFPSFSRTTKKQRIELLAGDHGRLSEASRRDRRGDPHRDGRADVARQGRTGPVRARPYRHDLAGAQRFRIRKGARQEPRSATSRSACAD